MCGEVEQCNRAKSDRQDETKFSKGNKFSSWERVLKFEFLIFLQGGESLEHYEWNFMILKPEAIV